MLSTIAKVVPLRKFQRTKGVFDYTVPLSLKIFQGDLVEVSFLNSRLPALVISTEKAVPSRPLKALEKMISPQLITPGQLRLMNWLADYSHVSLAAAAKLFVPPLPITSQLQLPTTVRNSKTLKPVNIRLGLVGQEKLAVRELLKKVRSRNEQVLVLVPEVHLAEHWRHELSDLLPTVYHGELPSSKRRAAWLAVRSGEDKLIVGTSVSLWLPYVNLGGVIIIQAESDSYWQGEQNPRYDALNVAQELAKINCASLARLSVAHRLEHWQASQVGQEKWQPLPQHRPPIIWFSLGSGAKHSKTLCSESIKNIEAVLRGGGKVFLYLNKKGEASSLICRDCGYTPTCSNCGRTLACAASGSQLVCFHCDLTQNQTAPCPRCGGLGVNYRGVGLSKLFREAEELWPKIKKCLLEGALSEDAFSQTAAAQLIVGNRTAARALTGQKLDLTVMVLPDTEISWPEFRATERLWQLLSLLRLQSKSLAVQTYRPEHYLWLALKSQSESAFYEKELELRKAYDYPPHTRLTRFIIMDVEPASALKKAQALKGKLSQTRIRTESLVGPYEDYFLRSGKKSRYYILLKSKPGLNARSLRSALPDDVVVEPDPYFILS